MEASEKPTGGDPVHDKIYMVLPNDNDHENHAPPDQHHVEPPGPGHHPGLGPATAYSEDQHVMRFWIIEIASMVIAAGLLATIWAVIARYDGKPVPEWQLAINLSTLVSLLAVAFRLAVIAPVVAVMTQQKWPWLFRKPRPLLDLLRIDSASSGALGSAELLLLGPRSPVAMLGAAILLLALAVGPVAQQTIRSVPCEQIVEGVNGSVPVANLMYDSNLRRPSTLGYDFSYSGLAPLVNNMANPNGNDTAIQATCPTGNCRFKEFGGVTYSSLGLCHACIDTSELVSRSTLDPEPVYAWPNGQNITNKFIVNRVNVLGQVGGPTNPSFNDLLGTAKHLWTPEFAAIVSNATANITIMALTNAPCSASPPNTACNTTETSRALAVTCALQPCIQRFFGQVVNGLLREQLVSTSNTIWTSIGGPNFTALELPCAIDNKLYDTSNFTLLDRTRYGFENITVNNTVFSAPRECFYNFHHAYENAFSNALEHQIFSGQCSTYSRSSGDVSCGTSYWLERFWEGGSANFTSVSRVIKEFATATSNHFRKAGSSLYGREVRPALGTVYTSTVCVSFAWPWLLWLLALYVIAAALLGVAIVGSYIDRGLPIWKGSQLPLLFYSMETPVAVGGMRDESDLSAAARGMNVEFVRHGELGYVRVS